MNQIVIPIARPESAESQAALALYRSLFHADAVPRRLAALADVGFAAEAATLSQRVAQRSLTWGTAAEAALRILATEPNAAEAETMARIDAAVAAVRVARGLAEDRRSCRDPWIDVLIDAASALCPATNPAVTSLLVNSRTYHQRLRSPSLDLDGYVDGLDCHPYVLAGELLRHYELTPVARPDLVAEFARAFGPLYQLISDLRVIGSTSPRSRNRIYIFTDILEPDGQFLSDVRPRPRSEIRQYAIAAGRQLLRTTRELKTEFPPSPSMDELFTRANMTLRDTAELLKQLG